MKRWLTGAMVVAGLWLSGCATAPFPRPEPFAASDRAPEEIPADFARSLAPRYELAQALVFRFYLREIAALGYVSVDVPALGGVMNDSARSMLNSWLLDYAREEPVYRLDDTTLGRIASRRIQRVDIDPGTITLRLD